MAYWQLSVLVPDANRVVLGSGRVDAANQLPITHECERSAGHTCPTCKSSASKPKCEDVPPEFYRSTNVFEHFRRAAALTPATDPKSATRTARAREYADRFCYELERFNKLVKKQYNGELDEYRKARRISYDENARRFDRGMGMTGSMTPNNWRVDNRQEDALLEALRNEEKRLIWYGKTAV